MRSFFMCVLIAASLSSCSLFRETVTITQVVKEKDVIDTTENPARKFMLKNQLAEKNVTLENVLVKEVSESSNIDYDFCIIADVQTKQGKIECYIYTKNINVISKLKGGKTKIDVKGQFSRFFTMLDDYYTKVEIIKASVTIKE